MINLVNKPQSISSQSTDNSCNFIRNGNFSDWSHGELIKGDGSTKNFADAWFGRRGNRADNITATKVTLPSGNAMRIARTENDLKTDNWAVAQIIDLKNFPQLVDKTVLFSAQIRAGAGYSSENNVLKLMINVSFQDISPVQNPFSLGKQSQSVAVLPIRLGQQWSHPILSGKIPEGAKSLMVRAVTNTMKQVPAIEDDFVEISKVKLEIDSEIEQKNQAQSSTIPIFHVASMARSGETVFLRSLAAHPEICNLVNVEAEEQDEKLQLFKYLQQYPNSRVSLSHPLVKRINLKRQKIILVKQGIWEHKYPFNGLVLVRNPISVYASLISYGLKGKNAQAELNKRKRNSGKSQNFQRWMREIDESIMNYYQDLNYLEQFCTLYNRRMYPLSQIGLPIVHYESFCQNPQQYLELVLQSFDLKYDQSVLNSHSKYESDYQGHGLINLSTPVNTKSLDKWKQYVSLQEFNRIASLTYNTWNAFGYNLNYQKISVKNEYQWLKNAKK